MKKIIILIFSYLFLIYGLWQFTYAKAITSMVNNIGENTYGIQSDIGGYNAPIENFRIEKIISFGVESDGTLASFVEEDYDQYEIIYGIGDNAKKYLIGMKPEEGVVYCGSDVAPLAVKAFPKYPIKIFNKSVKIFINGGIKELDEESIFIFLPFSNLPETVDKNQLLYNLTGKKETIEQVANSINQSSNRNYSVYNINEQIESYFGSNEYFGMIYGIFFVIVSIFVLVEMSVEYEERINCGIKNDSIMYFLGKNKYAIICEKILPDLLKVTIAMIVAIILLIPMDLGNEKWLGYLGVVMLSSVLLFVELMYIIKVFSKNRIVREIR